MAMSIKTAENVDLVDVVWQTGWQEKTNFAR